MSAITSTFKCAVCGTLNGKNTRSNNQNRYYWSVVVGLISEHTGFTPEEIHDILKHKFMGRNVVIGEDIVKISKSTASLTTIEFEKYLSEIKEWASMDLSIVIPDPNQALNEKTN